MHGAQGGEGAQGIAADVAGNEDLQLAEDRVEAAVGTTGAEGGGALGEGSPPALCSP
nr:hypothetical protein [Geotalea toluenoxydans]